MNWYALGFSRFADRWLLPTPGEIVPGASKDIEPVYQFAPHETELMFRQAEEMIAAGFPRTSPPDQSYVSPEVKLMGFSSWAELARKSYQWTIRFKDKEGYRVVLVGRGKRRSILDTNVADWGSAKGIVLQFTAYDFK